MKKYINIILLVNTLLFSFTLFGKLEKATLTTDHKKMGLKDEVTVTYTCYGEIAHLKDLVFVDFKKTGGPTESKNINTALVDGEYVSTSSTTLIYKLKPVKTGVCHVPAAVFVDSDGHELATNSLNIEVVAGSILSKAKERKTLLNDFSTLNKDLAASNEQYLVSCGPVYMDPDKSNMDATGMVMGTLESSMVLNHHAKDLGTYYWYDRPRRYFAITDTTNVLKDLTKWTWMDAKSKYLVKIVPAKEFKVMNEFRTLVSYKNYYSGVAEAFEKEDAISSKEVSIKIDLFFKRKEDVDKFKKAMEGSSFTFEDDKEGVSDDSKEGAHFGLRLISKPRGKTYLIALGDPLIKLVTESNTECSSISINSKN